MRHLIYCLFALVLGIGFYYAFAPYNYAFLLLLVFPLLYMLYRQSQNVKQAAFLGFAFAFGLYMRGMWWIGDVLAMPVNNMTFLKYPGVAFLSALFGLWYALAFGLGYWFFKRLSNPLMEILCFALMMHGAELAVGYFFGGFPWYITGYTLLPSAPLIQSASLVGLYGLSFLGIFFTLLLGAFFYMHCLLKTRLYMMLTGLFIFALMFNYGEKRIERFFEHARYEKAENIKLHLIDTTMPMDQKWKKGDEMRIVQSLVAQTKRANFDPQKLNVVIWPETAVAFDLYQNADLRQTIVKDFPQNVVFMIGAFRHDVKDGVKKVYNTLYVLDAFGNILDFYDKSHLVPFGEFIPFAHVFSFMHALVEGLPDLSEGEGLKSIALKNMPPFSPLLCYDAMFPSAVVRHDVWPSWLLTATNDGWFVSEDQKMQHFDIHRMRAAEYGMPLVRVANLGVTTMIDALGRDAFMMHRKMIETPLLKPLPQKTFFSQYPRVMSFFLFIFGLTLVIGYIFLKRKKKFYD